MLVCVCVCGVLVCVLIYVCVFCVLKIEINFSVNSKPEFELCVLLTLLRGLGPVVKNIDTSVTSTPAFALPVSFVSSDAVTTSLTPEDIGSAVLTAVALPLTSGVSGGQSRGTGVALFSVSEAFCVSAPALK